MIKANIEDKNLAVRLLADAFRDNQSVNYIVQQDEKKSKRIKALMDYSFEMCNQFGEIWFSDNNEACAMVLLPQLKRFTLLSLWLDIKLIFQAIGINGITKALKREANIKLLQPKVPMAYLWFIGVNPAAQHWGIGTKLLQELIEHYEVEELPFFLETSTVRNLPWYQALGFQVYNELDLGYKLYFLQRRPGKS